MHVLESYVKKRYTLNVEIRTFNASSLLNMDFKKNFSRPHNDRKEFATTLLPLFIYRKYPRRRKFDKENDNNAFNVIEILSNPKTLVCEQEYCVEQQFRRVNFICIHLRMFFSSEFLSLNHPSYSSNLFK